MLYFLVTLKFTFNSTDFNGVYGPYIEFKKSQLDEVIGDVFTDNPPDITIDGVNGTDTVFRLQDPFGSDYIYNSSSPSNNTASFDIYSFGPDKTDDSGAGTSDDITNW